MLSGAGILCKLLTPTLCRFRFSPLNIQKRGEMAEKGKRVLIEDNFSEDEELEGYKKSGIGIKSALEDVDGAPEEMRETRK